MICGLDSSILIAALKESEAFHSECRALLEQSQLHLFTHALAETFAMLTGGRLGGRLSPGDVSRLLASSVMPRVESVVLSGPELLTALAEAESRGVRGGAVYDFLHLVAARKVRAGRFYTLNVSDFRSFHRAGDPEIVHP